MANRVQKYSEISQEDKTMDVDVSYRQLASEIVEHCPSSFSKAKLSGQLVDDVSTFSLECVRPDGEKLLPRIGGLSASNIDDALHEIREAMTIPGQTPWSRCTFTLFPDGKFKFDVEYDD
jgi:hypothetical protein